MKLVILGAPGAGKGTQAYFLSQHYGIPHISTGNLLREHMKNKTPIGMEIEHLMNKGKLVPDGIAIAVLKERIKHEDCKHGFILDGFPRTVYQAKISEEVVGRLDRVISVHVDDEIIIERMSNRRICEKCGETYHLTYKPPQKGTVCDSCGSALIQRVDDKAKTVRNRLTIYHDEAEPIKDYYNSIDLLSVVNGLGEISDITNNIIKILEKLALD